MRYRRSCVQKLIALSLMLPTVAFGQGLDVASDAMKIERLLVNNPRVMTWDAARAIYAEQL